MAKLKKKSRKIFKSTTILHLIVQRERDPVVELYKFWSSFVINYYMLRTGKILNLYFGKVNLI